MSVKQSHRPFTLFWALLFSVALASALFALMRLKNLPILPVSLDPELHVRSVLASPSPETGPFQRNDRVVALRGRSIEDLRELRAALENLPGEETSNAAPDRGSHVVSYQIVRPLHRFNLLLQGEPLDPSALPPGVEEGDQLMELDGRPMRPRVGTEGLRNIISSRPEALLVFERPNAVFTGEVDLRVDPYSEEVLVSFVLCLLFMVLLWRKGHASLSAWTPLATGMQTLAFTWMSVFIFHYQWVLAEQALIYATIAALIMAGPLGIFARTASAHDGGARKWGSLALGVLGVAVVIIGLKAGRFPNPEVALQFAAVLGTFFVVFEVILTSLNEGAGVLLGERSRFLSFIILAILLAALIAYVVEPIEFVEERWRWFVAIVLGLVWIGDAQLCLGGLPMPAMANLASQVARRQKIARFLEEVELLAPGVRSEMIVSRQGSPGATSFSLADNGELRMRTTEKRDEDAAAIFFDEGTRIPSLTSEGLGTTEDELGVGLAVSMALDLVLPLHAPEHGLEMDEVRVVLFGRTRSMAREGEEEDEPSPDVVGSSLEPAMLDAIPEHMTSSRWAALVIEGLGHQSARGESSTSKKPSAVSPNVASSEETRGEIEALTREKNRIQASHTEELASVERQHLLELELFGRAPRLPQDFVELLEPELIEALDFLLSGELAPIVLTGPEGAGKTFVALASHRIACGEALVESAPCFVCNAAMHDIERFEELLSMGEEEGVSLLERCRGGSLIIEMAGWLSTSALLALCERSEHHDVQLYLCFEHPEPEKEPSILEAHGASILEVLGEREVMIPALVRRQTILPVVLEHWLEELAWQKGHEDLGLSPEALEALLLYDWPLNVEGMRLLLGHMLSRLGKSVLEYEDLPEEVRLHAEQRRSLMG